MRKMLKERLEEARAGKLGAEREQARASALAAGFQHDLELLKHEVITNLMVLQEAACKGYMYSQVPAT